MSETRYNVEYAYPEGLEAKDRILANATVNHVTYEVSDAEIESELYDRAREEAIEELTQKKLEQIRARGVS